MVYEFRKNAFECKGLISLIFDKEYGTCRDIGAP